MLELRTRSRRHHCSAQGPRIPRCRIRSPRGCPDLWWSCLHSRWPSCQGGTSLQGVGSCGLGRNLASADAVSNRVRFFAIPAGSEEVMLGGFYTIGSGVVAASHVVDPRLRCPRLAQEGAGDGCQARWFALNPFDFSLIETLDMYFQRSRFAIGWIISAVQTKSAAQDPVNQRAFGRTPSTFFFKVPNKAKIARLDRWVYSEVADPGRSRPKIARGFSGRGSLAPKRTGFHFGKIIGSLIIDNRSK